MLIVPLVKPVKYDSYFSPLRTEKCRFLKIIIKLQQTIKEIHNFIDWLLYWLLID